MFKSGPYVGVFGCVNNSHLVEVLELVQERISANSCDTLAAT